MSEYRMLGYTRENVETGNILVMTTLNGDQVYRVLLKAEDWREAYQGIDVEEAKRIAEGKDDG